MPIEMIFTAENADELKVQLRTFIGLLEFTPAPDPLPYTPIAARGAMQDAPKPQDTAKPRSHKKAAGKAPVAEPEASEEAVDGAEQMKSVTGAVNAVSGNGATATDTVAAMKVKDAVIPILQEAFAAGKAPKLRILLETYGDGAKSFPEIAPENFLGIQKAIKDGALKD